MVPFSPFDVGVSLFKLNSKGKGYPYHEGVTGEPRL